MDETTMLSRMKSPRDRRDCWRGGVVQIHILRACDKSCFHCTQISNIRGKAALMTPGQFRTAVETLRDHFGVVGIFGGNPSCRAGTRVFTTAGIFPIEELEGKRFTVRNLHGQESPAFCRLSGRGKRLFRIRLRGGHEYYATAEHEWPALSLQYGENHKRKDRPNYNPRKTVVALGKVKTVELRAGMRLPISSGDRMGFGAIGTGDDGFLAGWILGDGWIVESNPRTSGKRHVSGKKSGQRVQTHNSRAVGLIVNQADNEGGIGARLQKTLENLGSHATWRAVKSCFELNTRNASIDEWLSEFGVLGKKYGLPAATWGAGTDAFRAGLIDGLFSADGNVELGRHGHARIRLTTAHERLARDVSDLLGFYGIKTRVSSRIRRKTTFPNGKDYGKEYTTFEVSVESAASVSRFAKLFPLTHRGKQHRLESVAGRHTPDVEQDNIEIISVEETDLHEDVWDISVGDSTHCFQLPHCVTGNCLHPQFDEICAILRDVIPFERRGLWCNHPRGKGAICRETFNPHVSNLNVHLDQEAYNQFVTDWPETKGTINLKGLAEDSRHGPPFVAMQDVGYTDDQINQAASTCDVNQKWSSLIGVFRGELRAYFCELAYSQAALHAEDPNWPDTGLPVVPRWWDHPMEHFADQVRYHCRRCGMPINAFGQFAIGGDREQVSATHSDWYRPKTSTRPVELVTSIDQLGEGRVPSATSYLPIVP